MEENNIKKTKIAIIIFAIVAVILIAVLLIYNNIISKSESKEIISGQEVETTLKSSIEIKEVKSINEYSNINYCVDKYLDYIKSGDNNAVYNLLIDDYIKSENITTKNVLEKIGKIDFENQYMTKKVYSLEPEIGRTTYFVKGDILNKNKKKIYEYNVVLNVDFSTNTFQIAPLEKTYINYIDYSVFDDIKIKDEKIKSEIKEIKKSEYNNAEPITSYEDKDIMLFYFKQYILNMVYNPENAYSLLDENYRNKRFGSLENFKEYVKNNMDDIEKSEADTYKIKEFETYKEYFCRDKYNNCYIFKETEPMKYVVMLDQYTIDDEIFTEEYNEKGNSTKAQMNLVKFEQMINRKDYSSAYNVLNDKFRDKYFKTEESFKNYISENLFEHNKFEFIDVPTGDSQFVIKTEISNVVGGDEQDTKTKRFRVDLEEAGYKISFNV